MFRWLALGLLVACGTTVPESSVPAARTQVVLGRSPRPEWSYWEPAPLTLRPAPRAEEVAFPLAEGDIVGLPSHASARTKLREEGVAYAALPEATFAAAYRGLHARGVPILITADSLFFLTHLALSSAADELERDVLARDLQLVLDKAYVRLGTDALSAPPDLRPAYRLARAVVAVALVLLDETRKVSGDLQAIVAAEVGFVRRHAGFAVSPLFGFAIDYGALAPEGGATAKGALTGPHLALSWLAAAPLPLASNSELRDSPVNTGQARTATRAALLLASCTEPANDREMATAYDRLRAVLRFELGPTDDWSLTELAALANRQHVALAERRNFVSAITVDKLRHAATSGHEVEIYDGVFNLAARRAASSAHVGRSAASVRMFGSHASVDAGVRSQLLFPRVGARPAGSSHPRASQALRVMPSGLDLVAWMGSAPARAQLVADGDFAFDGFEAALSRAESLYPRSDSPRAHASLHDSWFDAVVTFVQPSLAEQAEPTFERPSYAVRKAELAAAAWALGRHDAEPFGRAASSLGGARERPASSVVAIESNPETYAKLLALLRQAERGFTALGVLGPRGKAALGEAASLLETAVAGAVAVVDAQPQPEALTTLPLALAAYEERHAQGEAGQVSVVADVHADANLGRVLEVGTGPLEELSLVVAKDDSSLMVARGPIVTFREHLQDARERLDDARWRLALAGGSIPARAPFQR